MGNQCVWAFRWWITHLGLLGDQTLPERVRCFGVTNRWMMGLGFWEKFVILCFGVVRCVGI